jgi:hypothetical protein
MKILRNIEKSFIGQIENKSNIDALKTLIKSYFDNKKVDDDALNQKYNKYIALFENERTKNNLEYNAYLNERAQIYDLWKKTKTKSALIDLAKLPRPIPKDVPDIYTHTIINVTERHITEKPIIKPVVKPAKPAKPNPKKEKECPEGKILNPITGRCINDANHKKTKVDKTDKPNKPVKANADKKCPEGKILNPKTGRCINDPNLKKPKKMAAKE